MPSKTVFLMPNEFFEWLNDVQSKLEMKVIIEIYNKGRILWDGQRESIVRLPKYQVQIFLADSISFSEELLQENDIFVRDGWVHIAELPENDCDKLFSIQISAKETWYNSHLREYQKAKLAKRNFGRVWRLLSKKLAFGLYAKALKIEKNVFYKEIGYSRGAADFFSKGGKLQQPGVKNSEFFIE